MNSRCYFLTSLIIFQTYIVKSHMNKAPIYTIRYTVVSIFHYVIATFLQNSARNDQVFTHDSIYAIARICHGNSVCPSVRLFDRHTGGSVENG